MTISPPLVIHWLQKHILAKVKVKPRALLSVRGLVYLKS